MNKRRSTLLTMHPAVEGLIQSTTNGRNEVRLCEGVHAGARHGVASAGIAAAELDVYFEDQRSSVARRPELEALLGICKLAMSWSSTKWTAWPGAWRACSP